MELLRKLLVTYVPKHRLPEAPGAPKGAIVEVIEEHPRGVAPLARVGPTRIYFWHGPSGSARFMWFHNTNPSEMLMGLSGLTTPEATLVEIYPERTLTPAQLRNIRFEYEESTSVRIPIDHITCHPDGKFHIKTRTETLYTHELKRVEPLGPDTSIFLEFIVLSDRARYYQSTVDLAKVPGVIINVDPEQVVTIRGMFSGSRYDIEGNMVGTIAKIRGGGPVAFPAVKLDGSTLKGILHYELSNPPEDIYRARPRGTILSFKFPVQDNLSLIKTFLLS